MMDGACSRRRQRALDGRSVDGEIAILKVRGEDRAYLRVHEWQGSSAAGHRVHVRALRRVPPQGRHGAGGRRVARIDEFDKMRDGTAWRSTRRWSSRPYPSRKRDHHRVQSRAAVLAAANPPSCVSAVFLFGFGFFPSRRMLFFSRREVSTTATKRLQCHPRPASDASRHVRARTQPSLSRFLSRRDIFHTRSVCILHRRR